MSLIREQQKAQVLLYERGQVSRITEQGVLLFQAASLNWQDCTFSTSSQEMGYTPDLVYVPELDGIILRPIIPNYENLSEDTRFTSGDWGASRVGNDVWGDYRELLGTDPGSMLLYDSTVSPNLFRQNPAIRSEPCIGIRVRRYEPVSGGSRDQRSRSGWAGTNVLFGNKWMLSIPVVGAPTLMEYYSGSWHDVKVLEYVANSQFGADAFEIVMLNLDGKLIFTADGFVTVDIHESSNFEWSEETRSYEDTGIVLPEAPVIIHGSGARQEIAVRSLNFPTSAFLTNVRKPVYLRGSATAISELALSARSACTGPNKTVSVSKVPIYLTKRGGILGGVVTQEEQTDALVYKVTLTGQGFNTPIYYGTMIRVDPEITASTLTDSCDITDDVEEISLTVPKEREQESIELRLNTIRRSTYGGNEKLKYQQTTADDADGFKGLSTFQFIRAKLGFVLKDTVTGTTYQPGTVENPWVRDFVGFLTEPSVSVNDRGMVSSLNCGNILCQAKEVFCDGTWGPYDGWFLPEALMHVFWQCGIPSGNFYIRSPQSYTLGPGGYTPSGDQWVLVEDLIDLLGAPDDGTSKASARTDWASMTTRLSSGKKGSSKWKPRLGDSGWNVALWLAGFENGAFFTSGFDVYYDPYYNLGLYPAYVEIHPGVGDWVFGWVPRTRTVEKTLQAYDSDRDDYVSYSQTRVSVMGENQARTVVVGGRVEASGQAINLVSLANDPRAVDPTSSRFIHFPKSVAAINPAWNSFSTVAGICRKLALRVFNVQRYHEIRTYGQAGIDPTDGIAVSDDLTGNGYFYEVETAKHSWSKDSGPWAESTFWGTQLGTVDGQGNVTLFDITE